MIEVRLCHVPKSQYFVGHGDFYIFINLKLDNASEIKRDRDRDYFLLTNTTMAKYEVSDKTFLITGGASGLGAHYVEAFLREGAKVRPN